MIVPYTMLLCVCFSYRPFYVRKRNGQKPQYSRYRQPIRRFQPTATLNSTNELTTKESISTIVAGNSSIDNYHIPKLSHSLSEVIKDIASVPCAAKRTRTRSITPTRRSNHKPDQTTSDSFSENTHRVGPSEKKSSLSCDKCAATYKDRTGLYKQKQRKHRPQDATTTLSQTLQSTSVQNEPVHDTVIHLSSPITTSVVPEIVPETGKVVASSSTISLFGDLTQNPLPNDIRQLLDIVIPDMTDVYLPQTTTSSTINLPKTNLANLTAAINGLFLSGNNDWSLPTAMLTSDNDVNKWLNELTYNIIMCTSGHIASRLRRTVVEGIANPGQEMRRIAGLCLFLDNKFSKQK